MKKIILGLIVVLSVLLNGCDGEKIVKDINVTIIFDTDGGTDVSDIIIEEGTVIEVPDSPTKEGYTFEGWYTSDDLLAAYDAATAILEDITIYAKWNEEIYSVTFVIDESESIVVENQAFDSVIDLPDSPIKLGYAFVGWASDVEGANIISEPKATGDNLVFYSVWEIKVNTIRFLDYDGTVLIEITEEYGTDLSELVVEDPFREGHLFSGWNNQVNYEIPITMPDNDLTITAAYEIQQYTLSVLDYDGYVRRTETVTFGADLSELGIEDPYRLGYTFTGWDVILPELMPGNYLTITATYEIKLNTIQFLDFDGTVLIEITENYETDLSGFVIEDPIREGYTFTVWNSDIPSTMPADNLTITAGYDINVHTVTYMDGDSILFVIEYVEYQEYVEYYEPIEFEVGYTFDVWLTADTVVDGDQRFYMPDNDVVLQLLTKYADFDIIFIDENGDEYGRTSLQYTASFDDAIYLDASEYPGYSFVEWTGIPETMPINDVTLTPVYEINSYEVVYYIDGIEVDRETVKYNAEFITYVMPLDDHFELSEWFNDSDLTVTYQHAEMPAMNLNLYAERYGIVYTDIGDLHDVSLSDDIVHFEGTVSVIFDKGYFLSDGSNSICIHNPDSSTNVQIGDVVSVEGEYGAYFSMYQIKLLSEESIISSGNIVSQTPSVISIEDLLALNIYDLLVSGSMYTVTGEVVLKDDDSNVYLIDGDNEILVASYSLDSSLLALKEKVGSVVTIDVTYYTYHGMNGLSTIFDGDSGDISVETASTLLTEENLTMLVGLAGLFTIVPEEREYLGIGEHILTVNGINPVTGNRGMYDEESILFSNFNTVTTDEFVEVIETYNSSISTPNSYLATILPLISIITDFDTEYTAGGFTLVLTKVNDEQYVLTITGTVLSEEITFKVVVDDVALIDEYTYTIRFTTSIATWYYEINRDIFGVTSMMEIIEFLGDSYGIVYLNYYSFENGDLQGYNFKDELGITRIMYFEVTNEYSSIYYLNDDTGTEKYMSYNSLGEIVFEYENYMPTIPFVGTEKSRWFLNQFTGIESIQYNDGLFIKDYTFNTDQYNITESDTFEIEAKNYISYEYNDVTLESTKVLSEAWVLRNDTTWGEAGLFSYELFMIPTFTYDVESTLTDLITNFTGLEIISILGTDIVKDDVLAYIVD